MKSSLEKPDIVKQEDTHWLSHTSNLNQKSEPWLDKSFCLNIKSIESNWLLSLYKYGAIGRSLVFPCWVLLGH